MRVHLALGATDMRKGFDGLAAQVKMALKADQFSDRLFPFRGRRGDLLQALWWDGQGLMRLAKRLEKGRFIWPTIAREGVVTLTTVQLAMLLEGLDRRTPTAHLLGREKDWG
ncbi:MAG: IS66 family insertion sequence element accessory protein TnpB [Acetobacteraceae bacterium]|jgi:transposase|nr:IS66 family insertion sequence element accessory protein TnpB [Acetobacteraceae bacterium]